MFCTILFSDSFQRAKNKLKKAELVTDVNTDSDELIAKKRRRILAAKHFNNTDSEQEDAFVERVPAFPRQPTMRQRSNDNDASISAHCSKKDTSCK